MANKKRRPCDYFAAASTLYGRILIAHLATHTDVSIHFGYLTFVFQRFLHIN